MRKISLTLLVSILLISFLVPAVFADIPGCMSAPVIINGVVTTDADIFVSSDSANNKIHLIVDVTGSNLSNIAYVTANLSQLSTQTGVDYVNLTYLYSNYYNATITVQNINGLVSEFQPVNITVFANTIDSCNYSGTPYTTVILYNMTTPASDPATCMMFGNQTTDFSKETNFSKINFTIEAQINLSCQMNMTIPNLTWANQYTTLAKLNFQSLDFTNTTTIMTLSQLPSALEVNITAPGDFGDSRIFLDSSVLYSLNTTSTISLYHLPFTSQPYIEEEVSGGLNTSGTWSQGIGEGNLTFTVNHFSGYNITDNSTPVITINTPINNSYTTQNSLAINVILNGTGTQISYVNISINGTQIANLSNCTQLGEISTCSITNDISALPNATHTLTVFTKDTGSDAGNNATKIYVFTKDQVAPTAVLISNPSNSGWLNANFNVTINVTDNSAIDYLNYTMNGVTTKSNGSGVKTISISTEGNYTLSYIAVDNAGNQYQNQTQILLDKTAPSVTIDNGGSVKYAKSTFTETAIVNDLMSDINISTIEWREIDLGEGIRFSNYSALSTNINASSDWNYTIGFNVKDNVGNLKSSNFTLVWDTTAPVNVTGSAPSGTIYTSTSTTISCSGVDTVSGTVTGSTTFTSESSAGTYSKTCTVTDQAGNSNSTTVSYTVTAKSYSSGGSSTTSSNTSSTTSTSSQAIIMSVINPNTPTDVGFSNSELTVSNVEIVIAVIEKTARITMVDYDEKPSSVSDLTDDSTIKKVYGYLEIAHPSIENKDIKSAKIDFKVEKSWMTTNGYKKEQVILYRYVGNEWTKITTKYVKEDSKYLYFEGDSPGLSFFAIGIEKDTTTQSSTSTTSKNTTTTKETTPTTTEKTTTENTANTKNTTTPSTTETKATTTPKTEKKSSGKTWFTIIVIALIAAAIAAFFIYRNKEDVVIVKAGSGANIPIKVTSKEEYEEKHHNHENHHHK